MGKSDNSRGYDSYKHANADIGEVMDYLQEHEKVAGVELDDTDHVANSKVRWSNVTLSLTIRPADYWDEDSDDADHAGV